MLSTREMFERRRQRNRTSLKKNANGQPRLSIHRTSRKFLHPIASGKKTTPQNREIYSMWENILLRRIGKLLRVILHTLGALPVPLLLHPGNTHMIPIQPKLT